MTVDAGPTAVPAGPAAASTGRRSRIAPHLATPSGLARVVAPVAWALVALAAAYGVVVRVWLLAHLPLNSDEAVVGLMGRAIAAGHPNTFYWGQQYGGAEPYPVALVLRVVNGGPMGLNGTAAVLAAVGAALVGLAVAEATRNRVVGALAGALAWVWPYAVVWTSVRESGFREAVLCCGMALVVCALRVHRRRAGWGTFAVLGLAAGVGWWASPEIVYFVLPAAVLLVVSWGRLFAAGHRLDRPLRWQPPAVAVATAVVGALPWIWTNVGTGFASLQAGSLPNTTGLDYGQRLSVFFSDMLPMQLGLRTVPGGGWVGGDRVGPVLYGLAGAVVLAALARAALAVRRGRAAAPWLAVGVAVVAFPFVYALVPASGYWEDGRYGVLLPPLVVLLLALALVRSPAGVAPRHVARHARRAADGVPAGPSAVGSLALLVGCAGLAVGGVLTVATARAGGVPASPGSFFGGWTDPDAAPRQVASAMAAHGIRYAYGNYWTAYDLDFIDPTRLAVSPSPHDVDRWPAMAARVAQAPRPAWLFFAPGHEAEATQAFGGNTDPGPGGLTEPQFLDLLRSDHVPYRVVHLGVLDAVVPARRVRLPG
ncbi:MAG TPA: hypothetical protein VHB02_13930 [Acidimicrobiales bacterium]|nr:hypothetical protein [Acidimicrobiales bacterium]